MRNALILVTGMCLLSVSTFAGDVVVAPTVGYGFGGATGRMCQNLPSAFACEATQLNIGGSVAWTFGRFGIEEEVNASPDLLGTSLKGGPVLRSNSVTSAMTNVMFRQRIGKVEPYAVVGAGALHVHIGPDELTSVSPGGTTSVTKIPGQTGFGYDAGVGTTGWLSGHVGFRVDYRYYREHSYFIGNPDTPVSFSRVSTGPVFRF